jgi:RNA polymerase sigma-70 factor, ECF subfamily
MFTAAEARLEEPDEALTRAQAGEPEAFAELVHRHQSMVFSLAVHVLRNQALAEEVSQEVFLELHRHLIRIDSDAHLTFWLRRVTSHRCIDCVRRNKQRPELVVDVLPERPVPPFSRDLFLEERLRTLLSELPIQARLVMALRYQEDLQPLEIASTLGMSVNTVKSHLRRSLAVLRGSLLKRGLCV